MWDIEISTNDIIKESKTSINGQEYIVYIDSNNSDDKIRVNTCYLQRGTKISLCLSYDRRLCNTLEEYNNLSIEYIENEAYGSWMDGARGER